ncbi:MAG TPA: hypothetical protein VGV85_00030 [Longimicrobiaceae bacterium]|nr:hypothetical protein [Longimicrobiaceae bacterium]
MSRGVVVSLCDRTGIMVRPWAEAGYRCLCFDLQHALRSDRVDEFPGGGSITYRWANVLSLAPDDVPGPVAFAAAFPDCAALTKTAAQDWPRKGLRALIDALTLVESCRLLLAYLGAPWCIENPVGRLGTIWRAADHAFDPCDFGGYLEPAGDAYTKRTCLWTGGGFVMPEPRRVEPVEGSKMHTAYAPGPERKNLRSVTPEGFARAVFLANAREHRRPDLFSVSPAPAAGDVAPVVRGG